MEQLLDRLLTKPNLQQAQIAGTTVRRFVTRDPERVMNGLLAWSEHGEKFVRIASGVGYGVVGTRDRNLLPDVLPYVERLANDHEMLVREHGAQAALEQLWLTHADAMWNVADTWIHSKNENTREVVARTIARVATSGQIQRPSILRQFIERGIALYDKMVLDASRRLRAALAEGIDEMGCFAPDLVGPFLREWASREEPSALRLVLEVCKLPFGGSCEGLDARSIRQRLHAREDAVRTRMASLVRSGAGGVDYQQMLGRELLAEKTNSFVPWVWVADAYRGCQLRCEFCHSRALSEWVGDTPDTFSRRISVVQNAVELLAKELARPHMQPRDKNVICIGFESDPYQPAEERFELTRNLLTTCLEFEHPVVLQTREELVLRDVEILQQLADRGLVNVLIAMQTAIEGIRNKIELGTSTVTERFRTIRMLSKAGVPVGLMLSPIMPDLTDDESILEETVRRAVDVGAQWVVSQVLDLRGSARVKVRLFLESYIGTLVDRYKEVYATGRKRGMADPDYIHHLAFEVVPEIAERHGCDDISRMLTSGKRPEDLMARHLRED